MCVKIFYFYSFILVLIFSSNFLVDFCVESYSIFGNTHLDMATPSNSGKRSKETTLIKPDWDCTELVFIRHGESFNNCIYEQVRQRFGHTLSDEDFEKEIDKLHDPDCGLSPKGTKQAEALGNYIKNTGLEMVTDSSRWTFYSSPMHRALLTAQQVSRAYGGKEVLVHPNLFESDGCYEPNHDGTTRGVPGMSKAVVESKFPNFRCLDGMENGWFKLPQKETRKQFYERAKEMVQFLWEEHDKIHASSSKDMSCSEKTDVDECNSMKESATAQSKPEGILIVAHGNIIASIISYLIGTNALFAQCNTGISHIQLWTHKKSKHRLVSVLSTNRIPHLSHSPELHGGEQIFEDHWIQEFLAPDE